MNEYNLEQKKELLKKWIDVYIDKFEEIGDSFNYERYRSLYCCIDLCYSKDSIKKLEHLFNIRIQIEKHILTGNFDKKYKKLNEKLVYNINKLMNKIYLVDCKSNEFDIMRISVFSDEDLKIYTSQRNIQYYDLS